MKNHNSSIWRRFIWFRLFEYRSLLSKFARFFKTKSSDETMKRLRTLCTQVGCGIYSSIGICQQFLSIRNVLPFVLCLSFALFEFRIAANWWNLPQQSLCLTNTKVCVCVCAKLGNKKIRKIHKKNFFVCFVSFPFSKNSIKFGINREEHDGTMYLLFHKNLIEFTFKRFKWEMYKYFRCLLFRLSLFLVFGFSFFLSPH